MSVPIAVTKFPKEVCIVCIVTSKKLPEVVKLVIAWPIVFKFKLKLSNGPPEAVNISNPSVFRVVSSESLKLENTPPSP